MQMSIGDTCEITELLLLAMNKALTDNLHLAIKNIHLYARGLEVTENVTCFCTLRPQFISPEFTKFLNISETQ